MIPENQKEIDSLLAVFTTSVSNATMTGECRDAVIELLLKNVDAHYLEWGNKFIRIGGLIFILFDNVSLVIIFNALRMLIRLIQPAHLTCSLLE